MFQKLKLKFIWVRILMNLGAKFRIFSHYIFRDRIQGSYGFCKLSNYISNRWPGEIRPNFLSKHEIEIL